MKKEDQIGKAVAKTFNSTNKVVTPSEVAEYLGIHPNTAKNRIEKFEKKGFIKCKKEGNRLYCKRKKKINQSDI
ncbi:MAG: hypothetical protein ACFE85_19400 [Candidatus Hodarchaeota archaeon]